MEFKTILIGDSNVGKSSILKILLNKDFDSSLGEQNNRTTNSFYIYWSIPDLRILDGSMRGDVVMKVTDTNPK